MDQSERVNAASQPCRQVAYHETKFATLCGKFIIIFISDLHASVYHAKHIVCLVWVYLAAGTFSLLLALGTNL